MGKKVQTLNQLKKKNAVKVSSISEMKEQEYQDFYQSTEWKHFRERCRKQKRKDHDEIVLKIYMNNSKNDPADLIEYLTDPKKYPLSEQSLKRGIIKRATVADHIIPIKQDESKKLDPRNIQWLTHTEHQKKRAQEAHL